MIVDDSATMRKIIMRTVRMSGLEFERTKEAGSGTEALEKLKAGPIDVVLCDIKRIENISGNASAIRRFALTPLSGGISFRLVMPWTQIHR